MLDKKKIGLNVKKAREIKSLSLGYRFTQRMLAEAINTSQSYIGDIESGRTPPSTKIISAIADICGVSVDFILGKEKKKTSNLISPKPSQALRKLLTKYLILSIYLLSVTLPLDHLS